ncbi:MAG: ABC transporter permease [Acidimicrobiales bacterium]
MWRVTIKGLLAHKLRLALTGLAIVLGVTFVSGTLVLTDTLHNTFSTLFTQVYQHVDLEVRGKAIFSGGTGVGAVRNPFAESVLATVRGVPGVQIADGGVGGYAQFVDKKGKAVVTGGAPTIGASFSPDRRLSSMRLVAGAAPLTSSQVVMDEGTANKYGFHVGNRVRILLPGTPRTFTVSGIIRFGTANNLAGATIAGFDLVTAQRLFDEVGRLDVIDIIVAPGTNIAAVRQAVAQVLPKGIEVVTGQTVANEATSSVDQALGFFSTALLVFAFIALFVGAFTIFNTLSILVGQRTRELALLRIVGASRRQIFRSVLLEAFLLGLVASLVGLGLGVLTAVGLTALLKAFGISLPQGSLVFSTRTVIVALLVGVGVTVLSSIGPARRAVRIPPIAVIATYQGSSGPLARRRTIAGAVVGVLGVVALGVGLAQPAIQLVGLGAVGIFIGLGMLAPLVAKPMSRVIGRPLAMFLGVAGRLGRENSMRSPRRTAQTAAALMVGLALVSTMAVFGASISKSATSSIINAVASDYIITPSSPGGSQAGFSNAAVGAAARVAGVTTASSIYGGQFEFQRSVSTVIAISPGDLSRNVLLRTVSGSGPAALSGGGLLIDTTIAHKKHLTVGSLVRVTFAATGPGTMRVGAIYEPNAVLGSFVVGDGFFHAHFAASQLPVVLLLRTAGGATAATTAALKAGLRGFPDLKIQTRAEFIKFNQAQVNQLLGLVYALLALAILIALIGIVNTLMLSVFERTHEIGLLRAVGMKRRQVKTMIRAEAVILSVFGAVIGIITGTALGLALVESLQQQGVTQVVAPISNLFVFLILAALLGLVAASWPARRAARLNVLEAIAVD